MWVIKYITLTLIFGGTSFIGILIAKKYSNRLKELQEIKKALHMLEVKMKFTYMSIPVIFREIETQVYGNIAKIFGNCAEKIEYMPAEKAWNESIYNSNTNLLPKDKEVLNGLGQMIKDGAKMDINLLFKIAAIGILVAVLHQVLVRAGREDQAMMTTLAGLVIVLTMVIKEISTLFNTVRTIFNL